MRKNDRLLEELLELRAFKEAHEGKAINRAFSRLEQLLELPAYDPVISRRAFVILSDALIALRDEVIDGKKTKDL